MQTQVCDANGNAVTEFTAYCASCGAHIKYVFPWQGKTYGSTCIEAVSGIREGDWEWANGQPSLEATEAKLQRIAEQTARNEALAQQREATRAANQAKYIELINVLNNASRYIGDFCWSMADCIWNAGYSTKLTDILSENQFRIVREIWGKRTGGRGGSKAYNAAVLEFDQKFDQEAID